MKVKREEYTQEDYHAARIAGNYASAAMIAYWLAKQPGLSEHVRKDWKTEAARMMYLGSL